MTIQVDDDRTAGEFHGLRSIGDQVHDNLVYLRRFGPNGQLGAMGLQIDGDGCRNGRTEKFDGFLDDGR